MAYHHWQVCIYFQCQDDNGTGFWKMFYFLGFLLCLKLGIRPTLSSATGHCLPKNKNKNIKMLQEMGSHAMDIYDYLLSGIGGLILMFLPL